jgi:non-ribosomal peptide synthetase component E (peptide arylation enzyme)
MTRFEHVSQVYADERIAEYKEQGLWPDVLLIDQLDRHAAQRPDDIAVVDETRRCTWRELKVRSDRIAAGLVDLGLAPGEFIALQLPNCIEFVEAYLAAQRAGLRVLTLMTIYRQHDVAFMLAKCRARAIVVPERHRGYDFTAMAGRLLDEVPSLEHVIVAGEPGPRMVALEALEREPGPATFASRRPDPDSVSKVSFTSGTTGRPKGVTQTHNTDWAPALLTARAMGLGPTTPIWMPSPIAHTTGLLFGVYDSMLCGAKLILQDQWDAGRALELIERERPVFTVSATPFIAGLVEHPDLSRRDVSSFRYFLSGGAPIPTRLVERARDEMGCLLLRVFGQAEAPLHTLNHPTDPWEKLITTDGRPLPGCEVRVADSARRGDAARGEVGEYATRGPHVFLGYYDEPELTAEARDPDGWYYSGDLCRIDAEGHVTYVDRLKDIINRGGVKISALEVESLVCRHPSVARCAVVAMPDERLGERICAFVVPVDGQEPTLEDITTMLDGLEVTRQKWPERLICLGALPTTATGKVQKNLLRDQIGQPGDRVSR